MLAICPGCNGVGHRPGKFVAPGYGHATVGDPPYFEANPCPACGGLGTQYVADYMPPIANSIPPSPGFPMWMPTVCTCDTTSGCFCLVHPGRRPAGENS
jgi:hypothetical protein